MLKSTKISLLLALIIIAVSWFGWQTIFDSKKKTQTTVETKAQGLLLEDSGDIKLSVVGIVEAANTATVAASASGAIQEMLVAEGTRVTKNNLLATQVTPVIDAEIAYQGAELDLTQVQQTANVEVLTATAKKAAAAAVSAETIAVSRSEADSSRVQEDTAALKTSIESSITITLDALNFVQNNRRLFANDSRKKFADIVNNLYGHLPKYFQGRITYSTIESNDILEQIKTLRSLDVNELPVLDTQSLGILVSGQLQALVDLYTTAEKNVLDSESVSYQSDVYKKYFTERASVVTALSELESAQASLQATIDSRQIAHAQNAESVVVTDIDRESAKRQAVLASDIAEAATAVSEAKQSMALAKKSLGDVRAPFAGVVTSVLMEVGEYANPGDPLFTLVGDGAREMSVSIPFSFVSEIKMGTPFYVEGEMVGVVDRFSPVSQGYSYEVVISLFTGQFEPGVSLAGDLWIPTSANLFAVPREYIFFDYKGAYVRDEAKENHYTDIVMDNGEELVISFASKKKGVPSKTLLRNRSVVLQTE